MGRIAGRIRGFPTALLEERVDQALIPVAPEDLSDNGENLCSVCLEPLNEGSVVQTPCEHRFHDSCVRDWLVRSRENPCPLCRVAVVSLDPEEP